MASSDEASNICQTQLHGAGEGGGDDAPESLEWSNSTTVILRRQGISMTFGIRDL
jgi:hypothetical protein